MKGDEKMEVLQEAKEYSIVTTEKNELCSNELSCTLNKCKGN